MSATTATDAGVASPLRLLVTGEATGGTLAIVAMSVDRDSRSPRHTHAHEDEIVYILAGHLSFTLNGTSVDAPTGSCLTLPRNIEHSYQVLSDTAHLLVIITPAGLENFYRELASSRPLPAEHLITAASHYGITITGPAP